MIAVLLRGTFAAACIKTCLNFSSNPKTFSEQDGLPPHGPHQQASAGRQTSPPCLHLSRLLLLLLLSLILFCLSVHHHYHLLLTPFQQLLHFCSFLPSHCQDTAKNLPGEGREGDQRIICSLLCLSWWPCGERKDWDFHQVLYHWPDVIHPHEYVDYCDFPSQGRRAAWVPGDKEEKCRLERNSTAQVPFNFLCKTPTYIQQKP